MSWQQPPKGNVGGPSGGTPFYPGYNSGPNYGNRGYTPGTYNAGNYQQNYSNEYAPKSYSQYNGEFNTVPRGGGGGNLVKGQSQYFDNNNFPEASGFSPYNCSNPEYSAQNYSTYYPNNVGSSAYPIHNTNVIQPQAPVPLQSATKDTLSQKAHREISSPTSPESPAENIGATAPFPRRKGGGTLSVSKSKKAIEEKKEEASIPSPTEATEETIQSPLSETSLPTQKSSSTSSPPPGKDSKDLKAKPSTEETREYVKSELAKQRQQDKKQYVRDSRPHFNVVFCGHVDAGKSTISGHLLMEKGLVDEREMEKLKREAVIHHREGWEYAYVMDVSEEERTKGITRETGAAYFETEKRRITVLDAPGHKAFVPSMIGGAAQADICVLVISSRTGEFETGFEKGGQTREHAMLVRTCGVRQMLCVINKMDEMKWSKERYDEIVKKLRPFLKQNGYDEKQNNLIFVPVAGLTGENLIKHTPEEVCPWYKGPTIMDIIDNLVLPETKMEDDVLCIPLVGGYKDDGKSYIYGKVESGSIAVGEKLQILPGKKEALVEGISIESTDFEKCYPGDNAHFRVRGLDENDVHAGYVATSIPTSLRTVEFIQARINILDVKNIISEGSQFMLHIHSAQEEASFHKLLAKIDRKTNAVVEKDPACAKAGDVIIARLELSCPMVIECHKDFDKMGRFMIRDEGKTIAIGIVTKLYESTHEKLKK